MKDYDKFNFTESIDDPSDFYFPLSSRLTVLRVNRQIRQEILPLAYRRTIFHLDDIENLIQLLVAVGRIDRDNIESLKLALKLAPLLSSSNIIVVSPCLAAECSTLRL